MVERLSIFVFLLGLLFLNGCSTISIIVPGATIETPQTLGSGKMETGPSLEPAREIEYTNSVSNRPPDLDTGRAVGTTHQLLNLVRRGLGKRFEYGGQLGLDLTVNGEINTTLMLVGKFQFLGPNKKQAKRGDFSGALHTRFGYLETNGEGEQSGDVFTQGFPWEAKAKALYAMGGLSLGYQVFNSLLFYVGGSYQNIEASIEVDQQRANDNSDPGGSFVRHLEGMSVAYGFGFQLRLSRMIYLDTKFMTFQFQLDGITDLDDQRAAGGFRVYF